MLREKIILSILSSVILFVLIQTILLKGIPKFVKNSNANLDTNFISPKSLVLNNENISNNPLGINKWGKDIFYNRKYIYDDWFKLTGITQFATGRKAIINGEILKEMDRLKGFIVQDIFDTKVVLKKNKYRVTLNLEQ